ncbi:MAG: ABC transporter permease [Gemmatimonadales bacterium]
MSNKLPGWLIAFCAVIYLFLHIPIIVLVIFSFNASKFSVDWVGFTWEWYRRLLERDDILNGLKVSMIVGVSSMVLSAILGTLIALALARYKFRGRTALEAFLYVPLVTPEIVVGISLLILFVLIGFPLGIMTITIAHVAFCISFVVVVVLARLQGMDQHLEEAALTLGADELTTFWRITVPQLWPGIISGALLAFTMSFDDYVITSFVSGTGSSTLPIVVYGMVRKNIEPSINAISTIILVATAALIYAADRLSRDKPLSH